MLVLELIENEFAAILKFMNGDFMSRVRAIIASKYGSGKYFKLLSFQVFCACMNPRSCKLTYFLGLSIDCYVNFLVYLQSYLSASQLLIT